MVLNVISIRKTNFRPPAKSGRIFGDQNLPVRPLIDERN
nr:MAG TPA: hypothetical protein [Caudoviricetes sp.]